MTRLTGALAVAVGVSACGGDEVTLECGLDVSDVVEVIVLDPAERRATMLANRSSPRQRSGTVSVTESLYQVHLPRTAEAAELHYEIDRRTRRADRWFVDESGEPYLRIEATCHPRDE